MDTLLALLHGFSVAAHPANLLWALVGVTCGTAVGILPGIGPALTVALLLPVTYRLDPTGSLIMFAGVYSGAQHGSSTKALLLNPTGESSPIVTPIVGHHLARAARGDAALAPGGTSRSACGPRAD